MLSESWDCGRIRISDDDRLRCSNLLCSQQPEKDQWNLIWSTIYFNFRYIKLNKSNMCRNSLFVLGFGSLKLILLFPLSRWASDYIRVRQNTAAPMVRGWVMINLNQMFLRMLSTGPNTVVSWTVVQFHRWFLNCHWHSPMPFLAPRPTWIMWSV